MKLLGCKLRVKSLALKLYSRWSVILSCFLYLIFFSLTQVLQIPLKSSDKVKGLEHTKSKQTNNIVEYLHKLHNLNYNVKEDAERTKEKEKFRPYDTVEDVFRKADSNHDNYLNYNELSLWINAKTQEHIHDAIVENYKIFTIIDVHPKNGVISWEEYHSYFLKKSGLNESYSINHKKKHKELNRISREIIMRDKAAWSECAKTDPDHLTLDEFLSFKHPESSYSTIISIVDEIFKKFDRDGDEILTEDEFSTLQTEDDYDKVEQSNSEEKARRQEFREVVDLNKDGKATRREVLTYIDPKNPRHAKEEAETLIGLADLDSDGRLTLPEIFNKIDLFLGSKMIDTARSFHDEF